MQLNHRPVSTHQHMFSVKFRAVRQDFLQLFKCMCEELGLAVIVTGKRMCSLDDPIHVVRHVVEEPFTISGFEIVENFANVSSAQRQSYNRSCSRHLK